jgi:hypothetical protein
MRFIGLSPDAATLILEVIGFLVAFSLLLASATLLSRRLNRLFLLAFVGNLAFVSLGWVIGYNMSNSREPAVAAVLPAVLTLVAGTIAYVMGTRGLTARYFIGLAAAAFSLSLFIASFAGARQRFDFETALVQPEALLYKERHDERRRQIILAERVAFEAELRRRIHHLATTQGIDLSDIISPAVKK